MASFWNNGGTLEKRRLFLAQNAIFAGRMIIIRILCSRRDEESLGE